MLEKTLNKISHLDDTKRIKPFWKFRFDEHAYIKDFKYGNLKKHATIALIIWLFSDYLSQKVFKKSILIIKQNINLPNFTTFVYYIVIPFVIFFFIKRISKGYTPSFNSLINYLIYVALFGYLIESNSELISQLKIESHEIIHIIFVSFLILLSKWSLYFVRVNSEDLNYQFLIDKKNEKDLFAYKGLSNEIERFIHSTESEHSFAIGVLGNWGDGKSFLTNTLLGELKKNREDYIVLDFNPWLYEKNQLIDSFFNEFLNAVSSIDRSLKNDFSAYASKITDQSNNEKIQLTNLLVKLLTDSRTINEVKCSISEKLKYSRKKVVIFIDDTDRLDLEEILCVLKIIRNSANFSNTFFITGIDYNYLHSKVEDPKYLEKIFNVLVALPKVSPSVLKTEIIKRFKTNFQEHHKLIEALEDLLQYEWFMSFLKNLRQVNRLINSFKIAYNKLGENVDLIDLLVLETLKNSATKTYFELFNNRIKAETFNSPDKLESESLRTQINEVKNPDILEALQYLFKKKSDHLRTFNSNYQLMFFNYSYEGVNISDFYDIIAKSKLEIVDQFNKWVAENEIHKNELLQLLTLYLKGRPLDDDYNNFIRILLELDDSEFSERIFQDIYIPIPDKHSKANEDLIKNNYFNNILGIISDYTDPNPKLSLDWTFSISRFLLQHRKNNTNSTLNNEELLIITENYQRSFEKFLKSNEKFEEKYYAFQKCIIEINDDRVIYDAECKKIFKNYILEDDNLIELLKASIKPLYGKFNKNVPEITIEDFLHVIFDDEDELLKLVNKISPSTTVPPVKFIKLYISEYYKYRKDKQSSFSKHIHDENLVNEFEVYYNIDKI
ncbi:MULTISPECIES: P-loop NTPase fold protein [Sphingobacterium]|uniref:KAP family P-loop NTPase fold protein n=1 Tax=Sphingobacterium TaxID=28453 RepID=UPI00104404ED|nr:MULTISPECIES: P-loop NTPase fold protein [Sphingobacterium]MCW2260120.1 hypothetical protein [Sphingobacterium kitahiroshimense]TCR11089.1 KAP-like P-loop domain-containing protein [Sphingobacterium sp. JUb78]